MATNADEHGLFAKEDEFETKERTNSCEEGQRSIYEPLEGVQLEAPGLGCSKPIDASCASKSAQNSPNASDYERNQKALSLEFDDKSS